MDSISNTNCNNINLNISTNITNINIRTHVTTNITNITNTCPRPRLLQVSTARWFLSSRQYHTSTSRASSVGPAATMLTSRPSTTCSPLA